MGYLYFFLKKNKTPEYRNTQSIPMPPNNRPRRIPRPNHNILILLQTNQPPTTTPHSQRRQDTPKYRPDDRSCPAAAQGDAHRAAGDNHQGQCEEDMAGPGDVAQLAAEDGEEAENFDGEEHEAEDVGCGGEAGGEDGGSHYGGVGREGSWEFSGASALAASVVEGEDVHYEEPAAHGPD